MEDRAARERIELLQRLDRRAAARGGRSPRAGTGTGHAAYFCSADSEYGRAPQALRLEHRPGHAGDARDAVVRRPLRSPARPARRHRSLERLVQAQQVVRVAADRRGRLDLEQLPEHRRGRARGRRSRRPGCAGAGHASPAPPSAAARVLELLRLRDAPGDRAHDVERIEARDPRPRLGDLDPRIRQPQPLGRRADRQAQQQALAARAILLQRAARRRAARASRDRAASDPRAGAAGTSAPPGPATKTTRNVRPRACCGLPTNTRP